LAGPTEILIIADETSDPFILAADLLGQAEHDPNARQALAALSRDIAQATIKEAYYKIADVCERACNYENMLAHGISCKVRKEK